MSCLLYFGLLCPFRTDCACVYSSEPKRSRWVQEQHRRKYLWRQSAKEKFDQVSEGIATEIDPVKQVRIRAILSDIGRKAEELDLLERASSKKLESLRTPLKESEAHFAQSEILGFIGSNRRHFTPLIVTSAMAGLPFVTARVSCEQCSKFGIKLLHGLAFEVFLTIERQLPEPIRGLGRSIDEFREFLLNGPQHSLAHAAELRKN